MIKRPDDGVMAPYELFCDKCGTYLKDKSYFDLMRRCRKQGWFRIGFTPSDNCDLDICGRCAKKHSLADLNIQMHEVSTLGEI